MQFVDHFSVLSERYDAFLLDLWGVVHDGTQIYPGARECLERLHAGGKKVVFLSNAPRRAHKVAKVLAGYGVEENWYTGIVSSGEVGFHALERGELPYGKRYYYIGPERDADMMDGLDFTPVPTVAGCDFILNLGFGSEGEATEQFHPVLQEAARLKKPMLCLNPDLEVVKITGERYPCAGAIAREFENLGGNAAYFGKPYPQVYAMALRLLGDVERGKVLVVGDSLHHDIAGANRVGIQSTLVTGGLLREQFAGLTDDEASLASLREYCRAERAMPDYAMPTFSW